ncbi:hypothetical protein ACFQPA_18440 [Halomarina halobia]|uniref:Uncharacterized protein n=1 Tax=Halomarina halobia TaxID=3033386 RepID=A0ABD6ACX6_9EURY|nr:hypothetical protein [Halomarina sp. PSR21]
MERTPGVRCYRCGITYAYIGSEVHPGRCPECGSRAVSPSGRVVLRRHDLEADRRDGDEAVIYASDASGREYRYALALLDGAHAVLASLRVDEESIRRPRRGWPAELLPEAVRRALRENGISLVGTPESVD